MKCTLIVPYQFTLASDGPIIRNNKLVGFVHGYNLDLDNLGSAQLTLYFTFHLNLI